MNVIPIIQAIGTASIIGALVYVGRKLQVLNDVMASNENIKQNLKVVSDVMIGNFATLNPRELQTYSPVTWPIIPKLPNKWYSSPVLNQYYGGNGDITNF